ncbi:hypothetical protein FHT08_001501 [Xanthomonas campestris]|nr:hypothetical protein [Xanthomonas sp. CFBP 8151]
MPAAFCIAAPEPCRQGSVTFFAWRRVPLRRTAHAWPLKNSGETSSVCRQVLAGTQPSRAVRTLENSFKQVASMDFDSSQQLRILRDIHDTTPVADEEANWAVRAGYATQAEDGDIDLTHEGRKALDDGQT